MAKALTVKGLERIDKEAAPGSRQEIPDGLLVGLYLVRQPSKAMSWAVRYRHAGQPRKLTLGAFPAISLEAARDIGRKALRAAAEGRDPASEKQTAKVEAQRKAAEEARGRRDLFENVAREFLERHAMKNTREASWNETARILGFRSSPDEPGKLVEAAGDVLPTWKGRRVQEITKRDVIALLDTVHDRAPVMANRTLAAVRKLFNWCVARDVLQVSPCTLVTPPAQERSRKRVLTDDELRTVWNATDAESWPFGPMVKLMILTGQREGEIAGMRWSELDLDEAIWTLPDTRVKNDEPHTVPLSAAALEIIKKLPRIKSAQGFVFAGHSGRPPTAFSRAKDRLDDAIAEADPEASIEKWVFHDLRRTVASGMAGLGIQLPVIEKILNHRSGTFRGIVAVYQRYSFEKEKRAALDAWASHVESVVSGKQPTNVVQLRGSK